MDKMKIVPEMFEDFREGIEVVKYVDMLHNEIKSLQKKKGKCKGCEDVYDLSECVYALDSDKCRVAHLESKIDNMCADCDELFKLQQENEKLKME
jgi:hypothetical protein